TRNFMRSRTPTLFNWMNFPLLVLASVRMVVVWVLVTTVSDSASKTSVAAALTTSLTVVLCTRLPLVPVIVKVLVPTGVDVLVVTVRVEDPGAALEAGLKPAVAPLGRPLTLQATAPLKPLMLPAFTVYVVLLPGVTVCDDGVAETEKSVNGAVTVSLTKSGWARVIDCPLVAVNEPVPTILTL